MEITAASIKQLRAATGAGVMDCRKALEATAGDFDKAVDWLREKVEAAAARKAGRDAREGVVEVYSHTGGRVGVMVEVNCETDFVARTEQFRTFAHDLALHIAAANPLWLDAADVPADLIESEKGDYRKRALAEGKAEAVVDKVVDGRLEAFYKDNCLLRQAFVKDDKITLADLLKQTVGALGENVVIRRFARYELGATEA